MNKLKKIYIIIIMIIALVILGNSSFATTGKVNTETLNLRKEASTTSSILKLLNFGEKIEILEESGDWYKVKAKGTTGYVHKDYVKVEENTNNNETQGKPLENETSGNEQSENQPSNNEGNNGQNNESSNNNQEVNNNQENNNGETNNQEVNNNPENNEINNTNNNETKIKVLTNIEVTISKDTKVYILPLLNSNVINNLKENNKIKLISYANGWLYIQNDSINGWIRIENIKENIFINVIANENQSSNNEGNNTKNSIINNVNNNNSNTINNTTNVNQQNGNNQTNNGQSNTITNNGQTSNEISETPITEKTMYVNYSSIYVRSGPGTNYSIVDSLIKNAGVRVIAESGDWYKVKVSNKIGYIAKRLLSNSTTSDGTSRGDVDRTEDDVTQSENKPTNNVEAENKVQNSTQTSNSKGEQIVEFAKKYLGCKYVYGGSGPSTFDCSGFTMYVYKNFGVSLSHSATAQSKNGVYVAKQDLMPGDLVFFKDYQTMDGIGHCGIYIGNGEFIHASSGTGYCVKISTLLSGSYNTRYSIARRLI